MEETIMATKKTSSKNSALKQAPKTPAPTQTREDIIREFLKIVSVDLESWPKQGRYKLQNNPFAWGASQFNTDLALAAQCESERDIHLDDDDYYDFFLSSEFQRLQQTFKEELEGCEDYPLVNLVWRAYKAGRLSTDRLEPDSGHVRRERARERDYWDKEHEKVMAAKQPAA
jgi:hypothetical protein